MYKIYDKWSEIARESFESHQESVDFDGVDHIIFAGMGGCNQIQEFSSRKCKDAWLSIKIG